MKFLSKKWECLVYLPVASVITITHSKFVIKNVKKSRWLPGLMTDTIYQTDFTPQGWSVAVLLDYSNIKMMW